MRHGSKSFLARITREQKAGAEQDAQQAVFQKGEHGGISLELW